MISGFLTKIFGSRNERLLKTYQRNVERINAFEPQIAALSNEELRAKTDELRGRVAAGETLEAVLPEAFAVVREAARRALEMRHFDGQIECGVEAAYQMAGQTMACNLIDPVAHEGIDAFIAKRRPDWPAKR